MRYVCAVVVMALLAACSSPALKYRDEATGEVREINQACDNASALGTSAVVEWRDFAVANKGTLSPEVLKAGKFAQIALAQALDVLEPMCPVKDLSDADRVRAQIEVVKAARNALVNVVFVGTDMLGGK